MHILDYYGIVHSGRSMGYDAMTRCIQKFALDYPESWLPAIPVERRAVETNARVTCLECIAGGS